MNKYYLRINDPNGDDFEGLLPLTNVEQAQKVFIHIAEENDWWLSECEYDDRFPTATILVVSDEIEVEIKDAMRKSEEKLIHDREKRQEEDEKRQFKMLQKKFGDKKK